MTDEQIMQGLKWCYQVEGSCGDCPYRPDDIKKAKCHDRLGNDVIDLIKRQQVKISELAEEKLVLQYDLQLAKEELMTIIENQTAEIERLNAEKDNLIKTYAECQVDFLKEFVNKLKTWHSYAKYDVAGHQQKQIVISEVTLDNLVKEMGCGE